MPDDAGPQRLQLFTTPPQALAGQVAYSPERPQQNVESENRRPLCRLRRSLSQRLDEPQPTAVTPRYHHLGMWRIVLLTVAALLCAVFAGRAAAQARPIRVIAWSERSEPAAVYPEGINGAIAAFLKTDPRVEVRTARLDDPDQGVSEAALQQTDVLIWFGHRHHDQVLDATVERVVRHVRENGMGFLAVHSSHFSKPLKALLQQLQDTPNVGAWLDYIEDAKPTRILVVAPQHPIARGVSDFTIPKTERYDEPFQVPGPETVVFDGRYADGRHARQGMCWRVGKGRIFYWRPGHETFPIFFQREVQQVITNAVHWLAEPS